MLSDAVAHLLGRRPIQLFVLWSRARTEESRIVQDVEQRFEVLDRVEVTWSPGPRFAANLSRFYGSDLPPGSDKEVHCGTGPFLLLVVRDHHPRYRPRRTSHGIKVLNSSVFDARRRYRSWTGGGHRIHAADSVDETRRNLALLLARPLAYLDDPTAVSTSHVRRHDADLAGADGWRSRQELALALRTHGARGRWPRTGSTVTLRASDVWEVALVAGGRPAGPGRRTVAVGDEVVTLVLRPSRPSRLQEQWTRLRARRRAR